MSTQIFAPGDRVIHEATGSRGTFTSTSDSIAVVEWDAAGVAMPGASLPIYDLIPLLDIRDFSDADIEAELSRRGIPLPPPGFTPSTAVAENRLEGSAPYGDDVQFNGPKHVTDTWRILSQWTPEEGITYFIDHDNDEPWTPAEVEDLPTALAEIKRLICTASAVQYLHKNHSGIDFMKMTITQVVQLAAKAGVPASAMFSAWEVLGNESGGSK